MRKPLSSLFTALFVSGLACVSLGSAQAQVGSAPAATSPSADPRAARMAEHRTAMQSRLHDTLKLSASQEGAWQKFTTSMQPPARPVRESMAGLTAPERADKMLEMSRQHQTVMEQHVAALKEFYAVLSPEQKRAFDAFHAGMQHSGRHMPMRGHGAQGHRGAAL